VLLHFMETFPAIERGVVMVQAEVGERLAARPGRRSTARRA
jgi:16S rRNA (adenine1518-N6/adenine1519-N6)-dimethyltransferase